MNKTETQAVTKKVAPKKQKQHKQDVILDLKNITKTFLEGKIIANDNISLPFLRNEVHAIVGENGSGKSTLMNIIFGLYKQDKGDIFINNKKVDMYQSGSSKKYKIGMVHQHFHLVDNFTVLENVILGQEKISSSEEEKKNIKKLEVNLMLIKNKIEKLGNKNSSFLKKINNLIDEEKLLQIELIKLGNIKKENKTKLAQISEENQPLKYKKIFENIQLISEEINSKKNEIKKINSKFKTIKNEDEKKILELKKEELIVERELWLNSVKITGFFGKINKKEAEKRLKIIQLKYNIKLDARAKVSNLSVGQRQMVEILKVLWQDKEVIVFDEPTATLSVVEIDDLLKTIKSLKKEGKTIIFISHKLKEVKEISDRISVLRKGKMMGTYKNDSKLKPEDISKLMVGKTIELNYPERKLKNKPILKINNLSYRTKSGFKALDNVSFEINEGEIFGLAGIEGNGQEEIIKIITDLRMPYKGEIRYLRNNPSENTVNNFNKLVSKLESDIKKLKEKLNKTKSEKQKTKLDFKFNEKKTKLESLKENTVKWRLLTDNNGYKVSGTNRRKFMSHVPIDRLKHGLIPVMSLDFNAKLSDFDTTFLSKNNKPKVSNEKLNEFTKNIINGMNVEGAFNNKIEIRNLSGGNQQKFIIGREIFRDHEIFIAGHPTRGLDISAIDHIYKEMIKNSKNKATLLYSLEINELLAVCDRVAVMYHGKIVDIIDPKKTSLEKISKMMIGEVR